MKPEAVTCPICEGPMVSRQSARGRFWGCRSFPKCRGTRDVDGESFAERGADGDRLPSDQARENDRGRWRQ